MEPDAEAHILFNHDLANEIDSIKRRLQENVYLAEAGKFTNLPTGTPSRSSPERMQAVTKLTEAIMWLGMDLKSMKDALQQQQAQTAEQGAAQSTGYSSTKL